MAWIAALIGAVGGGISASQQKAAAKKAARAQQAELAKLGDLSGLYGPYQDLGKASAYSLGELMGLQGYRTQEEQALTDFLKTKPALGAADPSPYLPGGIGGTLVKNERISTMGDSIGGVTKYIKKSKKKALARAQAAAQSKYQQDLSNWEAKRQELEKASQASLANYDPTAVLRKTPGYDFRYKTGEQATGNLLSRLGMSQSGRAAKELTQYGQDFASNEFNNEFSRRLAMVNPGLAATGAATNLQSRSLLGQADLYGNIGAANSAYYGDLNNILQGSIGNYLTYKNTQPTDTRSSSYGGNTYGSSSLADYFKSQDDYMR